MAKHILTEAEKEAMYDAERSGAAYVKPADAYVKSDMSAYINACLAQEQANPNLSMRQLNGTNGCMSFLVKRYGMEGAAERVAAAQQAREDTADDPRDDVLIGHIDGCEVLAHYLTDKNDPDQDDLAAATVIWQGMEISTDGHSYLSFPMDGGFVGDMQIAEWAALKRAAQTDIPERLIALAQRYPRFRDVPAQLPPAAPAVHAVCWYHDPDEGGDLTEEPRGPLAWVDYTCGEGDARARISFAAPSEPFSLSTSFAGHADLSLDVIEQAITNIQAVLNDPRVQAMRKKQ